MILEPKKIKSATVSFPSQSIYLEVNITILTPEKLDLDILVLKDPIINLDYIPSNFYSGLWGGKKSLKIYLFAVFECMSLGVLLTSKNNFPYTSEHSPQTPVVFVCSAPPSQQHDWTSEPKQETACAPLCQGRK